MLIKHVKMLYGVLNIIYGAKKRRGAVLPQLGGRLPHTLRQDAFLGGVKMMHILFSYFIRS